MELKLWATVLCSEYLLPGVPFLLLTLLTLETSPESPEILNHMEREDRRVKDIRDIKKIEKTRDPYRCCRRCGSTEIAGWWAGGWTSIF